MDGRVLEQNPSDALHLHEDVTRACHYMFLVLYATDICGTAQKKGLLAVPAQGSVCDVMIQFKKP